ncbi:uncharacterized protein LOC112054406 [Bicyclus anynana]|uniref:Uncharacterized protein LOC112054406 n=1 Tax=Bicyclus anynana TaxID=110368 RepID=A0A6J1NQH0_BICAN|nr:uncharacterized protein LOC112054406 [Bicyclus anynana]
MGEKLDRDITVTKSEAFSQQAKMVDHGARPRPRLVLEQCCYCCIPLRIGSLILAYLFLVGDIVNIILSITGFYSLVSILLTVPENYKSFVLKYTIIGGIDMVANLIELPFVVLLLIGLHKEKSKYVGVFLVFLVVITVLTLVQRIVSLSLSTPSVAHILWIFVALVHIAFNVYYIVVLRSHYLNMVEDAKNLPPPSAQQA